MNHREIRCCSGRRLAVMALCLSAGLPARALERLEPPEGCYVGINGDDADTISRVDARLGFDPAVHVEFVQFPPAAGSREHVDDFLAEVRAAGGIALLTLEPFEGLGAVTEAACIEIGDLCAREEALGIGGIMIRFAHEMNGNWYPWCQQPALYREKFRLLAGHVRQRTSRTALLWAPSYGGGYPYAPGGLYRAMPGTPDFAALDTDGNGVLSQEDDMYEPFYPGDDAVDWVGLTIYHWGVSYPWLENELPEPNSFAAQLTGNYSGQNGDQTAVPDFYARYSADGMHDKPLAIPETAAFFNPHQPGPAELDIKRAWWRQVFNISGDNPGAVDVAAHFPKMKCVNWFDHYKPETEARGQWIDWRISAWEPVRSAFASEVLAPRSGRRWFLTGQDFDCLWLPDCIKDGGLPAILPLAGRITAPLIITARTRSDLVVDLLDQDFNWQGGTRAPVTAGTSALTLSFLLERPLWHGTSYRWSIFLTPPGGDYLDAFAWYRGPGPVARAIAPAIKILGSPPAARSPSTITVRVKCTAPEPAVAVVNILDGAFNRYGGGALEVSRGESLLDIPVTLPTGLPDGDYLLAGFLSPSAGDWRSYSARSPGEQLRVAPAAARDEVHAIVEPSTLPAGEVLRLTVSYAAIADRDIHVDLFNAAGEYVTGAFQPVRAGSGVRDLVISHPGAFPGEYFIGAFIAPSGRPGNEAVAWSAEQRLRVLAPDDPRWMDPEVGIFRRGDTDGSGRVQITDAIALLSLLFLGGRAPPCDDAADANDDGELDISDAAFLLSYLFASHTPPPAPGPRDCGPDPTPSQLGECAHEACW